MRANMRYFGRTTRFGCACIPLPASCSMLEDSSCCSALTAEAVFFAFRSSGEAPMWENRLRDCSMKGTQG